MEILLWLVPAAIVTAVTMLWVAWWGRESRDQRRPRDRDESARRLGAALERAERRGPGYVVPRRGEDVSRGVALRSPRPRPVVIDGEAGDEGSSATRSRHDGEHGRQAS